ncbi:hypothetical protein [Dolichospermum phage Dfl-JY45]
MASDVESKRPGLMRFHLLNSYLKGPTTVALDKHASVCGANSAGKSTLQRPLLVFYGALPSSVVPPGRKSFESWYLPHDSSYLVFEYANHAGDLCQAVLNRSQDGASTEYRIIAGQFTIEDYIASRDGSTITLRSSRELFAYFRQKSVPITRQLNATEYRAVLQHNLEALRGNEESRRQLRGYAQQYALATSKKPLRHMEKLVKLVYTRNEKITAIRDMIGAILQDDDVTVPEIRLPPAHIESWHKASAALQKFDAMRDECLLIAKEGRSLEDTHRQLAEVESGLRDDRLSIDEKIERTTEERRRTHEGLQSAETRWAEELDAVNARLSKARSDKAAAEGRLTTSARTAQEWENRGVLGLIENLAKLPALRSDAESMKKQKAHLESECGDIKHEHEERLNEIYKDEEERRERAGKRREEAELKLREQEETNKVEREKREIEHEAARRKLKADGAAEIEALNEEWLRLREQAAQAPFTPQEAEKIENAKAAVRDQEALQDTLEKALRTARAELEKQRELHSAAEKARSMAAKELDRRRRETEDCRKRLNPLPGTLLEALRISMPDWGETLGRMIRPELLSRTDLSPAFGETNDAAFGVRLELSRIEPLPEAGQMALLEEALRRAQDAEDEATQRAMQANAALDEEVKDRAAAKTACEEAERRAEHAKSEVTRLRERRDQTERECADGRQIRKTAAQLQAKGLQSKIEQTKVAHRQSEHALAQAHAQEMRELAGHWAERLHPLKDARARSIEELDSIRLRAKEAKESARREYERRLKDRGIDEQALARLQKAIDELRRFIEGVESRRDEAAEYRAFVKERDEAEPRLHEEVSAATAQIAVCEADARAIRHSTTVERARYSETLKRLDEDLKNSRTQSERVASQLRTLWRMDLPKASAPRGRDVEHRLQIAAELAQEASRLTEFLRKGLERVGAVLNHAADSPLGEAWKRAQRESEVIDKKGAVTRPLDREAAKLGELVDGVASQLRAGILMEGRNLGGGLRNVFDLFRGVEKRITAIGRDIAREVDDSLPLAMIEDIEVKLFSKISKLEFWGDLEAFSALHKEWEEHGFEDFPPDRYADTLRRICGITSRYGGAFDFNSLIEIELSYREGGQLVRIQKDRDFDGGGSNGMTYLILMKFLLAFTRLLRGKERTRIVWPIDEMGTLTAENMKRVFDAASASGISVFGAFPDPDYHRLALFEERYFIKDRKVHIVRPEESFLKTRIKMLKNAGGASHAN